MSLTEEIIRRLNPPAKVSGIVSYLWSKMGREGRLAVAALTGLLFPFLVQNPYYLRLGTLAGLYVLLSLGLNVVVGLAGLLDLGYIAFYAVGAYTYALLASPHFGWHLSFWVVLPLAALLAAGTGILLGFPSLRLKGDYLAIVTLGFGEIIRILLVNLDRPINITNGPNGLLRIDPPVFLGIPLVQPRQLFLLVWAFAALAILFSQRLAGSYIGRAWRALKEDETVASFQGINPTWYKLQAFAVGAFLAGLAGVFFAAWQGAVFPQNFTLAEVITIFAMVILGGSGNVLGVVAGAIILTVLPEALRQYSVYRMLIYGLALVLLIRFRPEGLWPAVNGERLDLARPENTGLAEARRRRRPPESCGDMGQSLLPVGRPHAGYHGRLKGFSSKGEPLLEVKGVSLSFGGLRALEEVSFFLRPGEIVSLIGPNGAGKTSLFNLVTGLYRPETGRVFFQGRDITGQPPYRIAGLGIARTFQNPRLLARSSVFDNAILGGHLHFQGGLPGVLVSVGGQKRQEAAAREKARQRLALVGLNAAALGNRPGDTLSYADRRRLEIARALALEPELLLLDEPAAGMNPAEARLLSQQLIELRRMGLTILLVEHRMAMVMEISDRIIVLDRGRIIAEGSPREIRGNPAVVAAYLGKHVVGPRRAGRTLPLKAGNSAAKDPVRAPAAAVAGFAQAEDGRAGGLAAAPLPAAPLLKIRNLAAFYGQAQALRGLNLEVNAGEKVGLLGANGAGKTTTLRALLGSVRVAGGEVSFQGRRLDGLETAEIVRRGIAVVPEGRRLFRRLTVLENLRLGAYLYPEDHVFQETLKMVFELFPRLGERKEQVAGTLSGGEQQMLAVGRALMARPVLLCLDEPSMGLSPALTQDLFSALEAINQTGTAILLVEQNVNLALEFARRAYVLEAGQVVLQGTGEELLADSRVRGAYLGDR